MADLSCVMPKTFGSEGCLENSGLTTVLPLSITTTFKMKAQCHCNRLLSQIRYYYLLKQEDKFMRTMVSTECHHMISMLIDVQSHAEVSCVAKQEDFNDNK